MTSMSQDPAAAVIGGQVIEMGTRALAAGAAAAPTVTALAPAGAEEVSMQAAAAFAAEAAAALAAHTAAQEELMRAGAALIDVVRMYAQTDATAAGTMGASAMEFGGIGAAAVSTDLWRAPLMANLIEGVAASNPATAVPAAGNAAATSLGAATAPLSPIGQGAAAGVGAGSGAVPAAAGAASMVVGAATGPLSSISSIAQGAAAGGGAGPGLASSVDQAQDKSDGDDEQHQGEHLV
jgi:hypothetical protein